MSGYGSSPWGSGAFGDNAPDEPVTGDPVISDIDPAEGTRLGPLERVSFDVTGVGTAGLLVALRFDGGVEETIHDGTDFVGYYANPRSSRRAISGGYTFTVYRAGGWVEAFELRAYAIADAS